MVNSWITWVWTAWFTDVVTFAVLVGFTSMESTNQPRMSPLVGWICGCETQGYRGPIYPWVYNCIHCTMPYRIRDLNILRFWCSRGSWNQSPRDTEGWLDCTLCKLEFCGNPAWSKSISTAFLIVLPHFLSLCHILIVLTTFQIFSWLLYVLEWSVIVIFLSLFIFNWRIIALQYGIGFCHTPTWISHRYTYVPSLFNLSPTLHPIPTL